MWNVKFHIYGNSEYKAAITATVTDVFLFDCLCRLCGRRRYFCGTLIRWNELTADRMGYLLSRVATRRFWDDKLC